MSTEIITEKVTCSSCGGSGSYSCGSCGGRGRKVEIIRQPEKFNNLTGQHTPGSTTEKDLGSCGSCGGSGKVRCGSCGGQGYKYQRVEVTKTRGRTVESHSEETFCGEVVRTYHSSRFVEDPYGPEEKVEKKTLNS